MLVFKVYYMDIQDDKGMIIIVLNGVNELK